jgi:hypothetical protein
MNLRHLVVITVLWILGATITVHGMTASDKETYERLGLSQTEWELVEDAGMSMEKVEELLKAGISISEYFEYPWLELGMTEKEWIERRRAGVISDHMIAARSEHEKSYWAVVQNFFFPGFHQWKRRQYAKSFPMTGIALVSTLLFIFHADYDEGAPGSNRHPIYLMFLAGDMVWSSIDIGIQANKERNPDSERFTRYDIHGNEFSMRMTVPFGNKKD